MQQRDRILIRSARIYDPAQDWKGEIRDLYLAEGKVSAPFQDPGRIIEADGRPLLAGGIDPYCQVAAPGQIFLRMGGAFPSPWEIGRLYARMGYVHVHQPWMTLLTSGLAGYWLSRVPYVDKSCCVALDLRDMGHLVRAGNAGDFCRAARALMDASGAIGLLLPFPALRHRQRHYIQKNLSAKKVLAFLSALGDADLCPIRLWGAPGLLEHEIPGPERFHISGLGMALVGEESLARARRFLDAGGSADLGVSSGQEGLVVGCQDPEGSALLSMDLGLHHPVSFVFKRMALEEEPMRAGWALLGGREPFWRVSLSASGPSGGQFGGMPGVATWLLDPASAPGEIRDSMSMEGIGLWGLAGLTRLEPARLLGLADLGHLRPGARASVAIYDLRVGMETEEMVAALSDCWCLVKDGVVVRQEGRFTGLLPPAEIRRRRMNGEVSAFRQTDLFQRATLRFEHLGALENVG